MPVDYSDNGFGAKTNFYGGRQAAVRLDILIIGGGIGGLAAALCLGEAGHNVTVFEAARKLREVGAGLQVSPNVSRLLQRWGLGARLRELAVAPESLVFRRYSDGTAVGRSRWGAAVAAEHGAPYLHMHRADLHRILLERIRTCRRVSFRLGARVRALDPIPSPRVSLVLDDDERVEGDLIIGADGVHSLTRQVVCGRADIAQNTGDAAYRTVIPTSLMMDDPELRELVETPELTTWMGPGRHIMAYCIRAKKEYNLVMLHPDDFAEEDYTAEGNTEKMRRDFADFEPRVKKLLALVDRTLKWRLVERAPLASWVHPSGRVVLLGDACHPMLPYRAQGAAMAIEDAAVLGALLSRLASPAIRHLPRLLAAYEHLRRRRTAATQETSALNRYTFHLPDGPEQQARDASMRRAMLAEARAEASFAPARPRSAKKDGDGDGCGYGDAEQTSRAAAAPSLPRKNVANANQWADREKNREQYGYDADAVADAWWNAEGAAELEALVADADAATLASSHSHSSRGSGSGSGRKGTAPFWRWLTGNKSQAVAVSADGRY